MLLVYGLNETENRYLKRDMKIIGELASNDTSKIGMIPGASKDVFIIFADQNIYILNNKEKLNRIKVSTKMQKRESIFKYQSCIYNIQRSSDVNHRGMKIRHYNKLFLSFNVICGKLSPYESKDILRHYHYW